MDDGGHTAAKGGCATRPQRSLIVEELSASSSVGGGGGDGEEDIEDPFSDTVRNPQLDPHNVSNFSVRAWLSNSARFMKSRGQGDDRKFGICFRNLSVLGYATPTTDYQKTVTSAVWAATLGSLRRVVSRSESRTVPILHQFSGIVRAGEMLLVLGRPGSGCSTLLKTVAGETHGLFIDDDSHLNYQGLSLHDMQRRFRGEVIYMAEQDVHFPQLTVDETLSFAAQARPPPQDIFHDVNGKVISARLRDVAVAAFGLAEVRTTAVGSDLVKGVSGGERKRVSIAEVFLSGSSLQCWDNSTRGLDSANAIEFCNMLRVQSTTSRTTACVALYQAPQAAYEMFDKVTVLYDGRQIYFGSCKSAAAYFEHLGFERAPRQTTADFLTSLTSSERRVQAGCERSVPRTPDDFVARWKRSSAYQSMVDDISTFDLTFPLGGSVQREKMQSTQPRQATTHNRSSPYTLSFSQQVSLCVERGFQRLRHDATITITGVIVNSVMALVVGSVFYNLDESTNSFYSRSVLIFFAILLNAFASAMEILLLYGQRPIVEKQVRYAFYRPSAEAMAGLICDLPYKIGNAVFFNLVLYFMTNLRREPAAFFTFLIFTFVTTLVMSNMYRTFGALSRTLAQALVPAALIVLALIMYTGFVIPPTSMVPWFRWINYVNPIAYAFESLMINEFSDRMFGCANFVPSWPGHDGKETNRVCGVVGASLGSDIVRGEDYLRLSFGYETSHLWRNFGVIIAFTVLYLGTYLLAAEYISAQKPKGEILVFRRGHSRISQRSSDAETGGDGSPASSTFAQLTAASDDNKQTSIQKHSSTFSWRDICLDIQVNKEQRRILESVDGWIKPGTLTALLGPSGAGKTSLLDVLASRATIGIVSGQVCIDGSPRDASFQRKTGYVQQFDLHLATSTVRESLRFSALMRQPQTVTRKEKLDYAEKVIKLLEMEDYAEAVVGVPGEGLNVEQRKRLSIGVELAARPQLLIFLDEPTSGLDSQTAWSILDLLETLKKHGQTVLCTIHQPSAPLFSRFDRLLFLAPNGRPAYFGDIGPSCQTVIQYFELNGAKPCPRDGNPAEWLMEMIGCTPSSHSDVDWPAVWQHSPEHAEVHRELDKLQTSLTGTIESPTPEPYEYDEYALGWSGQLWECLKRVNLHYWRSPSYIYSKAALCILNALFLGLTFYKVDNTLQGLQSQTFSIFMLLTIFPNFVPQILPNLVTQRDLYEASEGPAKVYSWQVFLVANLATELAWSTLMSVMLFIVWYYPIGFYRNAVFTESVAERGGTMFLLLWVFLMLTTTFAFFIQAGIESAEAAGNAANGVFTFWLVFCGILVRPTAMPGFWIFMYRLSPFTYLIDAVLSVAVSQSEVRCSDIELIQFEAPKGMTCGLYMGPYIESHGGYLANGAAASGELCKYCPLAQADAFLELLDIRWDERWRNFGILLGYTVFNVLAAGVLYWLVRVPRKARRRNEGT
ncbi:putative ABC transporter [Apodospora peruviana]|uniref:ABC transporter n=1 Tax=Apodospora peruviana TaxID=516989 RepID=A0AAE0HSJ0_9PEZI|nr:putative ABC transporter [Apodospora peruviana]